MCIHTNRYTCSYKIIYKLENNQVWFKNVLTI